MRTLDDFCLRLHYLASPHQLAEPGPGEVDCPCPVCGSFVRMRSFRGENMLRLHIRNQRLWQSTQTLAWVFVILFSVMFIIKWVWLAFVILAIVLIAKTETFTSEEPAMKSFIMHVTGLKYVNMKLQAIADYLRVKFVHVPEHFKCEPLDN